VVLVGYIVSWIVIVFVSLIVRCCYLGSLFIVCYFSVVFSQSLFCKLDYCVLVSYFVS
jgi:hypothetical protein